MKRLVFFVFMICSLLCTSVYFESPIYAEEKEAIILYTNDVHCAIEGYANVAGYKAQLEAMGHDVLLIDAGDAIQGEVIGAKSEGEAIVDLMNQSEYDYATIGNHEFDYTTKRLLELKEKAQYKYLSCNFMNLQTNTTVFDEYDIVEMNGEDVAILGITTPETYTKTALSYFKDENGNLLYGFSEKNFYETIQKNIDMATQEGADRIIALGHLGIEGTSQGWKSVDVIANTSGIDVFIDAHSHETISKKICTDKNGKEVILSSTGTKLEKLGKLTLKENDIEETELVDVDTLLFDDATAIQKFKEVKQSITSYQEEIAYLYDVIGTSQVKLMATYEDGQWATRKQETNMGDFVADAYRSVTGADIAFVNGGGVRSDIEIGDVTRKDLIDVNPWGNKMVVIEASGQQILDALENGARACPDLLGGFLQVSGISFEIHTYIKSPVLLDEMGVFIGIDGQRERRVKNVKIHEKDIDPNQTYTIAGSTYVLVEESENPMFKGCKIIKDNLGTDNEMLIHYFENTLQKTIRKEQYENVDGDGRIVIMEEKPQTGVNTFDSSNTLAWLLGLSVSGHYILSKRHKKC